MNAETISNRDGYEMRGGEVWKELICGWVCLGQIVTDDEGYHIFRAHNEEFTCRDLRCLAGELSERNRVTE